MSATLERIPATAAPHPEEAATVQHRLHACARLFEILSLQVAAAAADDATGLASLQPQRRRVERAIQDTAGEADSAAICDLVPDVTRVLQHALDLLDGRSEEEQRLRDWITALQDASLPLLRGLVARPRSSARAV